MKHTINSIAAIMVLLIANFTNSQSLQWTYLHNNINWNANIGRDGVADNSGNVYVTGLNVSGSPISRNYFVHKINSNGNLIWDATHNGQQNSDDEANSVAIDNNGNIYVTGYTLDTVNHGKDITTIKYSPDGNTVWIRSYNGPANFDDIGLKIQTDNSGNVYVGGTSYGIASQTDYVVIKYNSNGTRLWVQRYNGNASSYDELRDMKVDAGGNVYATGSSVGTSTGPDYGTIKLDGSTGTQLWEARYHNAAGGSFNPDEAIALDIDLNGDVYVTGISNNPGSAFDILTQKYSSSGAQLWTKRYNGSSSSSDAPTGIAVDKSGNAYVCGSTYIDNQPYKRSAIIKYSSAGTENWVKTNSQSQTYDETAKKIAVDTNGTAFVTIESFDNSAQYIFVNAKLNASNGNFDWNHIYSANTQNFPNDIFTDRMLNIYVIGQSGAKSVTMKYAQNLVGIKNNNNNFAKDFKLEQNYPNPFNPSTTISFSIPEQSKVNLVVYDIAGKEVMTLINELKAAGNHEVLFNASGLSSGIYFYKLSAGDFSETKRMVLIK